MSQRNRDKIKSLFFREDGSSKFKMQDKTFSVAAGRFGEGSDTLTGIADILGVTYKSLKKENPQIKDPNKISAGQKINVPLRTMTSVERFILGEKTGKPSTRTVQVDGKKKKLAVKKGAEGRVYEGVTKKDMREITLEKNRGGFIDYRKGGMVLSTTDNRKKK
mgnify:FL=1